MIFLCGFMGDLWAQTTATQPLVNQLAESYNNFNYEETDRLLGIALESIGQFSRRDQTRIFEIAAIRSFQNDDVLQAEQYFYRLLEGDPSHNLDQLSTPPKIMALFQKTKVGYLENLNRRLSALEQAVFEPQKPWRSLVFPGWEQWHRGKKTRGAVWGVAGAVVLGGTVRAVLDSRNKKDEYLAETDPVRALEKYDDYNSAYQSQFYWAYSLAGIWIASHLDAVFFSEPKTRTTVSVNILARPDAALAGFRLNF
ncbi:MAG: hypothetical protein KDE52_06830 [Calditrichaeota bacterium]|nr:hypothetical protein [Calditrichota bacterium]MCB0299751.1 hypothetical protein [Calditrichota bacterium]MCB9068779.1 hypothetical protein [Calditrichia bacterium]